MEAVESPAANTPPAAPTSTRHYFYRKASSSSNSNTQQQPISPSNVLLDGLESSNAFENRINDFIKKNALQSSIARLRQDATIDLNRRKAERKARKEKEAGLSSAPAASAATPAEPTKTTGERPQLFEKLSGLTTAEQNAWLNNIHDDAMLMNPHQWLKLASLFNVNSKALRQQSLLNISNLETVLQDRNIKEQDSKHLESYLELRDIQNRNYARDA
jgi:hypothetical protein